MTFMSRRNALKLGLGGAALAAFASPARALVEITVTGGNFTPLPIAIPDFASSDPSFGKEMADIVRANLSRSGLFAPIDPASLPQRVGDVSATPDFPSWRAANADALVMGQVERGGQVQGSLRVWDTAQSAQVVGKSFNTDPQSYRRIAHIMSDAIYESLAGESGYFDTRVLYVAESGPKANRTKRIAIMDQDGANVQYLSAGRSLELNPRFSPGQDRFVFTSYADGNPQVFVGSLGGGAPQRLIQQAPMSFAARFSPDGNTIAFSVSNGALTNIYAVQGGSPVQLTNSSAIDTSPCYSPDGANIVFESDRGGSSQLYIMSAGGGGAQRISYGEGTYSTPVWSPKGDLIAYTRQSGGQFQIGIMKPDGSGERILSASGAVQEGPTWCPNGRVLMYFRDAGGDGGPRLQSVDIWGRNEQQIPTESFASDPSWSGLRG